MLGLSSSKPHRIPTATDPYAFALDPVVESRRQTHRLHLRRLRRLSGRHRHDRPQGPPPPRVLGRGRLTPGLGTGRTLDHVRDDRSVDRLDQPRERPHVAAPRRRQAPARQPGLVARRNAARLLASGRTRQLGHLRVRPGHGADEATRACAALGRRAGRGRATGATSPTSRSCRTSASRSRSIRPNGTGNHILTRGRGGAENPSWSPDGRTLSFVGFQPGKPESLWVIRANGSRARRLTRPDLTVISAAFAPRGDRIVFSARDSDASS